MAKKPETIFVCTECGFESPKWMGQCACGAWNSFHEERTRPADTGFGKRGSGSVARHGSTVIPEPKPLNACIPASADRVDTGVSELNRVLGGGLTKGTLTLIAGEPGIGKSTLILQAAIAIARQGLSVLYVSGEESAEQIRMRADRVASGRIPDGVLILPETDIDTIVEIVAAEPPAFLIIDSIQTMYTDGITSAAGSVTQIRACVDALMRTCKGRNIPTFIVAHVTKTGDLAGPKVIEHLVDCVLSFSGERGRDFRLLTSSKNRFGTTSEVGAFEMREDGLAGIEDLSGCLLDGPLGTAEGTICTAVHEGTRPLLMEIQALTAVCGGGFPRRASIGIDTGRLGMILAVLEKKARLDLSSSDVYINIVGGIRPEGTSADLAAALAIWSSAKGIVIPAGVLAAGEVGLAGEIRSIRNADKLAAEAAKLGFTRFILPQTNADKTKAPAGLRLTGVSDLREALAVIQL